MGGVANSKIMDLNYLGESQRIVTENFISTFKHAISGQKKGSVLGNRRLVKLEDYATYELNKKHVVCIGTYAEHMDGSFENKELLLSYTNDDIELYFSNNFMKDSVTVLRGTEPERISMDTPKDFAFHDSYDYEYKSSNNLYARYPTGTLNMTFSKDTASDYANDIVVEYSVPILQKYGNFVTCAFNLREFDDALKYYLTSSDDELRYENSVIDRSLVEFSHNLFVIIDYGVENYSPVIDPFIFSGNEEECIEWKPFGSTSVNKYIESIVNVTTLSQL